MMKGTKNGMQEALACWEADKDSTGTVLAYQVNIQLCFHLYTITVQSFDSTNKYFTAIIVTSSFTGMFLLLSMTSLLHVSLLCNYIQSHPVDY